MNTGCGGVKRDEPPFIWKDGSPQEGGRTSVVLCLPCIETPKDEGGLSEAERLL
jgi:hypothetical protein